MKNFGFYHSLLVGTVLVLASCSARYVDILDSPNGRLNDTARYVRGERHGIAPRAGADTLMIKGGGVRNGMAEYTFDAEIVPGKYVVTVDVGNYADLTLAKGSRVRLTAVPFGAARGSIIEPVKTWRPDPVRGGIEKWVFTFKIPPHSHHVGKRVGVAIWVPGMGKDSNISFDNLQVLSYPRVIGST